MKILELSGKEYGSLTVVARHGSLPPPSYQSLWLCRCKCGKYVVVRVGNLTSGNTTSCGCMGSRSTLAKRSTTHGKSKTREYETYCRMIARCFNRNSKDFRDYGGRGITVCEEWLGVGGFESFLSHIGPKPSPQHSIDRFPDTNGNYEPGNVRWATAKEQANNQNKTLILEIGGTIKPLTEWASISGLKPSTVRARLRRGWSPADAVGNPLIPHGYTLSTQ